MLITQKDFSILESKQRTVYVINAGLTREFIDIENCELRRRPVLYTTEVLGIIQRNILMARVEELLFRSWESGIINRDGDIFHPEGFHWIQQFQGDNVAGYVCSGKPKL